DRHHEPDARAGDAAESPEPQEDDPLPLRRHAHHRGEQEGDHEGEDDQREADRRPEGWRSYRERAADQDRDETADDEDDEENQRAHRAPPRGYGMDRSGTGAAGRLCASTAPVPDLSIRVDDEQPQRLGAGVGGAVPALGA